MPEFTVTLERTVRQKAIVILKERSLLEAINTAESQAKNGADWYLDEVVEDSSVVNVDQSTR